ncbi:uracil-DNA glycosylase family protein [Alkalilimnicola sp. S0819]|uniref:uracil-DNA glycosylase family protein n=1 Tax=Alkalilimnicola sp. S0819 TaxID=2613922 RepID=UPI00126224A7|nr:uracil-DNA glycosylase family protein [Alkalilimnicola sp. S0819]KAB7627815.1 single-stranded DNA-binding protein [Alkalilimnicola sp. S0819]MPQ15446.1 single-stranded DNA-binding protein [Alkalilimnicola sp. S0819]
MGLQQELERITRQLAAECDALSLGAPVDIVYNPLVYAWRPLQRYLALARPAPRALLLGMNPGPFGMGQTGVPFGEIPSVRDWLGIEDAVDQPPKVHPKRPIQGFDCHRAEVSGRRVWGWAKARYESPRAFFDDFFIWNYCPLLLYDTQGRNVTPDKLKKADREALFPVCDKALQAVVTALQVPCVIGVGRFAEQQAAAALAGRDVRIGTVTHPSPANPRSNQGEGWGPYMDEARATYLR